MKGDLLMYTHSFSETKAHVETLGAKGYHLVKMYQQNLPVPDGFIISTKALTALLQENQMNMDNKRLFNEVVQADFPTDLEEEILTSFHKLLAAYPSVAVRSSSIVEDLDQASFAGQYETFLHIQSDQEFLQKVKECWCSAFADRVQTYQGNMEEDMSDGHMAIVVQGLINAEMSGVAFSEDPITHEKDKVILSASYGLGEAIVSGSVTPDTYVINHENELISKQVGAKETMLLPDQDGIVERNTTKEQQQNCCLSDEQAKSVARLTKEIEGHYGYPVDVEFAFAESALFLLQARPITTSKEAAATLTDKRDEKMHPHLILSEDDKSEFWIKMDAVITGPVTPLFASFIIPGIRDGMKQLEEDFATGLSFQEIKIHEGYLFGKAQTAMDLTAIQIPEEQFPRLFERMMEILERDFFPFYEKVVSWSEQTLTFQGAIESVQALKDFYVLGYYQHFNIVFPQVLLQEKLERLFVEIYGEEDPLLFHQLLTGKMNKSLETDEKLWNFANKVKDSPILYAAFTEQKRDELINHLQSFTEGKALLNELDDFLENFGWRSIKSHDFVEETWVENPLYAISIIQNFVRNDFDFNQHFEEKRINRQEAYAKISKAADKRNVSPEQKATFDKLYQWAFDASSIRDDHHFYIDAMLDAKARVLLLNVADLLVSEGLLETKEMIWFVYDSELLEALQRKTSLIEISARRKQEHLDHEHYRAPTYFGKPTKDGEQFIEMMAGSINEDSRNAENQIYGVGASGGVSTGPAKVVNNPHDFDKLEPGDVLVCKMTTPVWTSLFQEAVAVVTDTGGMLSHSAIIAREYKLPAVLGTQTATESIADGEWLRVNGTTGLVEKI